MYNKEHYSSILTELSDAMQNVEDASAARPVPAGWMVQVRHDYYTGSGRSSLERWTPFPKFAKVYRRQGWAQKIATQLGGQVVAVLDGVNISD